MALAVPDEIERLRAQFTGRLRTISQQFTLGQKAVVGVAVAVLVIGGLIFMHIADRPTYTTLFTNLSASDAGSITAKLASEKIPYQLADNGATVLVPANDVDQQRITLAEAGLPANSSNPLSIVDKEGITTSDFTQQVDYQEGLQTELQDTINSISGVRSSQVNLVIPQTSAFALGNQQTPSASVLITTDGSTLSAGQVDAVVHLVASSVPNLTADEVTVADSNGDLLAGPGANTGQQSQTEETQAYDNALSLQIEQQLERILGPNNVDVNVNADLDYDTVNSTTHTIVTNPTTGTAITAPTSTSQSQTNFNGPSSDAGGIPGQAVPTSSSSSGNETYSTSSTQSTDDESTIDETVAQAPGKLNSLSVSVLANTAAIPAGVTNAQLQSLAAATANITQSDQPPTGNDQVVVLRAPFSNAIANANAASAASAAASAHHTAEINDIKDGVIALVLLLILGFIWWSARRSREEEILPGLPSMLGEAFDTRMIEPITEETPIVARNYEIPEGIQSEIESSTIGEFIEQQPEEVARLLRSWMQEGSGTSSRSPTGTVTRPTEEPTVSDEGL
jgi:flagellar M-ring protein FliF